MTSFASKSQYFDDKLSLFLTEVSFDTSEGNQQSYFQNCYFFKILRDFLSHIFREYADEQIK